MQKLDNKNRRVCLNLGSGKSYKKSTETEKWINIDINKDWKPDVLWELNKFPWPFKNSTFDYVYADNILEHFDGIQLKKVIKEIGRILKEDCFLEAIVPHFSNAAAHQINHKMYFHVNFFHPLNMPNVKVREVKLRLTMNKYLKWLNSLANMNPFLWERLFSYYYPPQMIIFKLSISKKIENKIR
ncbi:class I SAM-dependent methyltransferase [Candidatus Woesearchaeota archaeon]|nr:class I SAM-dependent methyltransferase [Candidatus Woesearchaeota archaeon]